MKISPQAFPKSNPSFTAKESITTTFLQARTTQLTMADHNNDAQVIQSTESLKQAAADKNAAGASISDEHIGKMRKFFFGDKARHHGSIWHADAATRKQNASNWIDKNRTTAISQ
ncbi:MAG: hypothetical protein Q9162_007189 [Coniocarpon cinnabarinum]